MEVSMKLKERFCKDCNIPIRIFQEPYFGERLELYDVFYGTKKRWEVFLEELGKYHCEQDYFEEYNCVKDAAILKIKGSEAYQRFQEEDMNQYGVLHKDLPAKDIFKPSNDGKSFISIDMKKANFSALRYYSKEIFCGDDTWEAFIGRFTGNRHIVSSKYIRQVILGNCNPRRHITYEKYLMDQVLTYLEDGGISVERVVFFSNDEIVIEVSKQSRSEQEEAFLQIEERVAGMEIPLKAEWFTLYKIGGTDGFYKEIFEKGQKSRIEFKCLDSYILPFVIRKFLKEAVTDWDKVFYYEGFLAQFIEVPQIEIRYEKEING